MAIKKLDLVQSETFDAAMDHLRQICFPGSYPTGSSRDHYDDRSIFLSVLVDSSLVGSCRLLPHPEDFLSDAFDEQMPPGTQNAVYLGRVMVDPGYRNHDIFELILIEAMLLSIDIGYSTVFGAARTSRKFLPLLQELGWVPYGTPKLANVAGYKESSEPQQVIVLSTDGRRAEWSARKRQILARLENAGFTVGTYGVAGEI